MAYPDEAPQKRKPGRPPGSRNKRAVAAEVQFERAAADLVLAHEQIDALTFLRRVYLDPKWPAYLRVEASKAVLKTEKPSLAAVAVDSTNEGSLAERLQRASERMRTLGYSVKTIEGVIDADDPATAAAQDAPLQPFPATETVPQPFPAAKPVQPPPVVFAQLLDAPEPISPARLRIEHALAARTAGRQPLTFEDLI